MLTFIVTEYGSVPQHSSIYEDGYELIAKEDILLEPLSYIYIQTGLILKCDLYDFIHLVIDNEYQNILKIENNIIENNINVPYNIKITNLIDNNVIIQKNNKICHFYSKNKVLLYNTILQDKFMYKEMFNQFFLNR
jgi:dUTPase